MMKRIIILAISALALTACGGNEQAKLQDLCTGMMGDDPAAVQGMVVVNTNVPDFCQCYAEKATAEGDDTLGTHTSIWRALAETKQHSDTNDLEAIVGVLSDSLRTSAGDYPFNQTQLDQLGRFVGEVSKGFDQTGTCVTN